MTEAANFFEYISIPFYIQGSKAGLKELRREIVNNGSYKRFLYTVPINGSYKRFRLTIPQTAFALYYWYTKRHEI